MRIGAALHFGAGHKMAGHVWKKEKARTIFTKRSHGRVKYLRKEIKDKWIVSNPTTKVGGLR